MTPGDQCRLSKLNLVIYNRAIFLLHPSKRKDCKDEVLAQICEKYSGRFSIILVLVRSEIFDHCIHSANSSKEAKKQRSMTCGKRQICKSLSPVTKTNSGKSWNLGRRGFKYPQYLRRKITIILTSIWIQLIFP